ncbi:MAG: cytoplasmic protein [Pseudomonadota bacterium]
MEKAALFVFNGDPMCFIHVLLNALDMKERGIAAAIVIEGAATGLIPALNTAGNPLNGLWKKVLSARLVAGVCRACATKTGTVKAAEDMGLPLLDDMSGHPSLTAYRQAGYDVITF